MLEWSKIFEQVSKIQIKSITDSIFRYALLSFIITIGASTLQVSEWLIILLAIISCLTMLVALVTFITFSIRNPDYLRSENFHLRKKSIEILGDKNNKLNPNISEIKYISNPEIERGKNINENFGSKNE